MFNIVSQESWKSFCALFFVTNWTHICLFQKDFRVQELPLARIKKIMKLDEDVKVRRVKIIDTSF